MQSILDQIPSQCAVCRDWGTQRVCASCINRYAALIARCERCALEVPPGVQQCGACLTSPPAYACTLAGVDYAFPWDRLILQFKFNGALALTNVFCRLLQDAKQRANNAARPDLLLPVPLSTERLRERGYNQAWELARRLGRTLRIPTDPRMLLRLQDTPHQLAFPPDGRAANVRGAFAIDPLRRLELVGRSVAVIDDVMTTGSTSAEIAKVLCQAGVGRIEIWVVARTPRPALAH